MKKVMSIAAVALLMIGLTGCCCKMCGADDDAKKCPDGCTKECCVEAAE